MKIREHSLFLDTGFRFWPPFWGAQEVRPGREHPKTRQETFCKAARILRSIELRARCGVLIWVSHPEYPEGMSGVLITPTKETAASLLQSVRGMRGMTIEELGALEVNDDFLPV